MVANIYVQDCVEHKTEHTYNYGTLEDLAGIVAGCKVYSGYPLVLSKLAKMLGFKGYLQFTLSPTLDQKENWDSLYSQVNAQN